MCTSVISNILYSVGKKHPVSYSTEGGNVSFMKEVRGKCPDQFKTTEPLW